MPIDDLKIAGGVTENGIVIGNTYDKYGSKNPLARLMMRGFDKALASLVATASPRTIHEIGCGEGHWVMKWSAQGLAARGCDFSTQVIKLARDNAAARGLPSNIFEVRSIYDLEAPRDHADLIVCCEVLEHLSDPHAGLLALRRVATSHLILSVPREPLWCALNLARGKYLAHWGNTPGHLQHWSSRSFIAMVSRDFIVKEVCTPVPWTMLLCRPRKH